MRILWRLLDKKDTAKFLAVSFFIVKQNEYLPDKVVMDHLVNRYTVSLW